jgi:hypothetical protein
MTALLTARKCPGAQTRSITEPPTAPTPTGPRPCHGLRGRSATRCRLDLSRPLDVSGTPRLENHLLRHGVGALLKHGLRDVDNEKVNLRPRHDRRRAPSFESKTLLSG